jgi:hypothetical protein
MAQPIVPFAHQLILCDQYSLRDRGKVDYLGTFDSIRPSTYPHNHRNLCVVAHLSGGLHGVNTYFNVRHAESGALISTTVPRIIEFPNRQILIRLAERFRDIQFPEPGIYLIELNCEHACIADTRLTLIELKTERQGELQ